jgi:PAS domain S-box-containing protein
MSGGTRKPRRARSLRALALSRLAGGAAVDLEKLTPSEILGFVQELEVHRAELEIQNEQLAEAQLAAEDSKERYRQLYESAPIGYLTLDSDGAIVSANRRVARLLGTPRARLIGRKLSSLVAEGHQDEWHFARRALAESSAPRSLELELLLDDGSKLEAQIVSSGRPDSAGRLSLALLDVTELRGAERALRKAASEASLAEQRERRSLASDLHDDVGQLLSLAILKLRALADALSEERQSHFQELTALLAETRHRITSLSFQLSPPLLHDVGLMAATRWLAEDLERSYGLSVSVSGRDEVPLDEGGRVTLFRAIRELLINVKKHAGVDRARVEIACEGRMARVAVEDEGAGSEGDADGSGFGLLALRERVGQLGGSVATGPGRDGKGHRVVVSVPLAAGEGGSS